MTKQSALLPIRPEFLSILFLAHTLRLSVQFECVEGLQPYTLKLYFEWLLDALNMDIGPIILINTITQAPVGADLSRTPPIYRPSVIFTMSESNS